MKKYIESQYHTANTAILDLIWDSRKVKDHEIGNLEIFAANIFLLPVNLSERIYIIEIQELIENP